MIFSERSWWRIPIAFVAVVLLCVTTAWAQQFDEQFDHWPTDPTIHGRIVIDNGVTDWEDSQTLLQRLIKGRAVECFRRETVSPTHPLAMALQEAVGEEGSYLDFPFPTLPLDQLKTALASDSVVVIQSGGGDDPTSDVAAMLKIKRQLDEFLARGGTLVVDKPVGALLGKYNVLSNGPPKDNDLGLNLIPDSVLLLNFDPKGTSKDDLLKAVTCHPRAVGIGLERGTLLVLSGRKVTCHGDGQATFVLAGRDQTSPRIESISPARSGRQAPQDSLLDLTEWRRDAIDRTLDPFPPLAPETPLVENGTLVIVGGGGMPRGLMSRFVELAGGNDEARLVYVPCQEEADASKDQGTVQAWKRMGVMHATMIHTKDRHRANSDDEFLAPLKDATGIWFGGGRQWNLADSYYGTKAHKMMKEVLHRGGVIGGSSAGASIQARYLARATPIGNTSIMAPGYERGGLGFIGGVAIDQHFTQRGRQKDMTQLMGRHPQLLGIGLDEATAIVVQKSKAEVVGQGRVFFYNRQQPVVADQPDYTALPDGSSYDLAKRTVLVDATKAESKDAETKGDKSDGK